MQSVSTTQQSDQHHEKDQFSMRRGIGIGIERDYGPSELRAFRIIAMYVRLLFQRSDQQQNRLAEDKEETFDEQKRV